VGVAQDSGVGGRDPVGVPVVGQLLSCRRITPAGGRPALRERRCVLGPLRWRNLRDQDRQGFGEKVGATDLSAAPGD
jgi:hypothetical protein